MLCIRSGNLKWMQEMNDSAGLPSLGVICVKWEDVEKQRSR